MKTLQMFLITALSIVIMSSCSKTPMTGRTQLKLNFESEMIRQGEQAYAELKAQSTLSRNREVIEAVNNVTNKLIKATDTYYRMNGKENALAKYNWEVNVFEIEQPNATCYPGGKIAVYTGILPIAMNEDGLAAIIGHEIAHALAGHGNERKSQTNVTSVGLTILDGYMRYKGKSIQTRQIINAGGALAAKYGFLMPFSRKHELEADEIGLYLMSIAGYDPAEAAGIWVRMEEKYGKSKDSFLATHPSHDKRIERLTALVGNAKEYAQVYKSESKDEAIAVTSFPSKNVLNQAPPVSEASKKATSPKQVTESSPVSMSLVPKQESPMENLERIATSSVNAQEVATTKQYFKIEIAQIYISNFREYIFRKGNLFEKIEATPISNSKQVRVLLTKPFSTKKEAATELTQIRQWGYKDAAILEYRNGELFSKIF
jgi:predicted Zn-dependent protease